MGYGINIPDLFFEVIYRGSRIPNVENQRDLSLGANCQVFAYELLRVNGVIAPNLRSSELWADTMSSQHVSTYEPLDLLLFNPTSESYGAHVAVSLGGIKLIHLSAENRIAEITTIQAMQTKPKYHVLLGGKRIIGKNAERKSIIN